MRLHTGPTPPRTQHRFLLEWMLPRREAIAQRSVVLAQLANDDGRWTTDN